MEQLDNIIYSSIEKIRSCKKQPNEDTLFNNIKNELPEITIDQLKDRLNSLLQNEKLLNKPHGGKNSFYNIVNDQNICNETPLPSSRLIETPHPPSHPPETPVRKTRIQNQSIQTTTLKVCDETDILTNPKEYVKHDTFKTFYDTFLEFRHAVDSKFEMMESF